MRQMELVSIVASKLVGEQERLEERNFLTEVIYPFMMECLLEEIQQREVRFNGRLGESSTIYD